MNKKNNSKTTKEPKKITKAAKKTSFGDIHSHYNNQVDLITSPKNQANKKKPVGKSPGSKNLLGKKPGPVRNSDIRKNEAYTKLFAYLIFVLFIFYIGGYFFVLANRETTDSTTVISGAIDEPLIAKGAIIRDETLFKSPVDGDVIYYVEDNEKIKSGTHVVSIQNSDNVDDILVELDNLDNKIFELQERRDDFSIAQKDAKRLASEIKLSIDNSMAGFSENNMGAFYRLKDNLDKKINVRNQLLLQEEATALKSYSEERQLALDSLDSNNQKIESPGSGIVSYYIDGFEVLFNFENLYSLTKANINSASKDKTVFNNKTVKQGDMVFKIINSNTWYIASYIDTAFIETWKEGDEKTISIEYNKNYDELNALVDRVIPGENESYVVFKLTSKVLNYINMREVNFKLSNSNEEGLKVINSAVTEMLLLKIPEKYIYGPDNDRIKHMVNGELKEETIRKYAPDQEYIWVVQQYPNIQYGDSVIDPNNPADTFKIEESMNINGVYLINSGIAKFARVYIKESVNGFTILEPSAEQGIRAYDVIVTDASGVTEGQRIYKKN
ncbi:MAG: hypothetical protein LBV08_05190 [Clostridiales bacterium]|jgi:hypothetical protein|nr:hypothetical protein [Clostridiales bacterium]